MNKETQKIPGVPRALHSNFVTDDSRSIHEEGKKIIGQPLPITEHLKRQVPNAHGSSEFDTETINTGEPGSKEYTREDNERDKQVWAEKREQWKKEQFELKEKDRLHWEEMINALESLEPTGNLVEDADKYFKAINADPNKLGDEWKDYFKTKDEEGMLIYFETVKDACSYNSKDETNDLIRRYMESTSDAVEKIINKTEEKKKAKGIKEKIDSL